jgi:erythromycin esterase-like protein
LVTLAATHFVPGEASHGTRELSESARITRIEEKIATDWPDAYRENHYVRNAIEDLDAPAALSEFRRFPRSIGEQLPK